MISFIINLLCAILLLIILILSIPFMPIVFLLYILWNIGQMIGDFIVELFKE